MDCLTRQIQPLIWPALSTANWRFHFPPYHVADSIPQLPPCFEAVRRRPLCDLPAGLVGAAEGQEQPVRHRAMFVPVQPNVPSEIIPEVIQAAFHRGLLLLGCGESAVRFCPPLCITAKQVDTALEILHDVLAEKTFSRDPKGSAVQRSPSGRG